MKVHFLDQNFEKVKKKFKCKFNHISHIFVTFFQNLNTKKLKNKQWMASIFVTKKYYFKSIFIDFIPLFDVHELLSKHFVSWYGHMDLLTCQNINKEIDWGHEMMGCMLLMPLT
jgi:hypothetical protein